MHHLPFLPRVFSPEQAGHHEQRRPSPPGLVQHVRILEALSVTPGKLCADYRLGHDPLSHGDRIPVN